MMEVLNHNPKICECCGGMYAGGKDYGWYGCPKEAVNLIREIHPHTLDGISAKGLCEFCNENNELWFNGNDCCNDRLKKLNKVVEYSIGHIHSKCGNRTGKRYFTRQPVSYDHL